MGIIDVFRPWFGKTEHFKFRTNDYSISIFEKVNEFEAKCVVTWEIDWLSNAEFTKLYRCIELPEHGDVFPAGKNIMLTYACVHDNAPKRLEPTAKKETPRPFERYIGRRNINYRK